jgi:protein gp37
MKGESNLPIQYAKPFSEIQLFPERLEQLKHWRKPKTIFVCSGSDLFHEKINDDFIGIVSRTIADNPRHLFLLLTKRIQRATEWLEKWQSSGVYGFLDNVILGITVWNQESADRDIPILLENWSGQTWLSIEPLLENIYIDDYLIHPHIPDGKIPLCENKIHQVIVGCESGANRRYCPENWIRNVVTQCKTADVSCYVKQIAMSDGKVITDPKLFPKDLQRRELIWQ